MSENERKLSDFVRKNSTLITASGVFLAIAYYFSTNTFRVSEQIPEQFVDDAVLISTFLPFVSFAIALVILWALISEIKEKNNERILTVFQSLLIALFGLVAIYVIINFQQPVEFIWNALIPFFLPIVVITKYTGNYIDREIRKNAKFSFVLFIVTGVIFYSNLANSVINGISNVQLRNASIGFFLLLGVLLLYSFVQSISHLKKIYEKNKKSIMNFICQGF